MRRATAAFSGLLLTAGLAGCTGGVPEPDDAADRFARALSTGELAGLRGQPDAQREYDDLLDSALTDLSRTVEVVDTSPVEPGRDDAEAREATATLEWTWDLEEYGGSRWRYRTEATLTRSGERWTPRFEPGVVHPDLQPGNVLDLAPVAPNRGDIVGAGGTPLVTERPVTRFGIAKDQVPAGRAAASARELAGLLEIDPGDFARRVRAAGPKAFVEGLVLRRDDVPPRVEQGLSRIRGGLAVADTLPLGPTPDFAEPILGTVGEVTAEMIEEDDSLRPGEERGLSGLQARYDDRLAGEPGVRVAVVGADGESSTVHDEPATDGEDLAVSLDQRLQRRAEALLADVGPASALVAVRPSDGAVLAAANGPGAGGVNLATYGQAAPGSTFKVVSALALLRDGATPATPMECPTTTVVDGKAFENYDDYPPGALGGITLSGALANSCNTAFVDAAAGLGEGALADAAASLGLGVDHDLGFPAYFGQVPPPGSETEAAADMIGQGGILASPMVMAAVVASVQEGSTVVPWLVDDVRSEPAADVAPLREREAGQLRGMMREVVRAGSGSALADLPGPPVIAKTGTAEFDRDGRRLLHAWMVAAQGDLAVAVYVDEGESGSQTAGPLLEAFLRSAR